MGVMFIPRIEGLPIAHGNNDVEVVIFQIPLDATTALMVNCFQNGKSCLPLQLSCFGGNIEI